MKLYFVRHGESIDASNGLYQRDTSPLSEKGIEQTKSISEELTGLHIDEVLASPVQRAKETALIINEKLELPLKFLDDLIEEKRPSIICGVSKYDKKAKDIISLIENNYHNNLYRHSDEDTFTLLKSRVQNLKKTLESLDDKNYLIVGHGMVLKICTGLLVYGEKLNSYDFVNLSSLLALDNTGICTFTYFSGKWTLDSWNFLKSI